MNEMLLVVDDHLESGIALARLLKNRGYDAVAVGSDAAALNILKSIKPQLIVLDVTMPQMTGIQFMRQLRATVDTSSVPVIVYSGDFHDEIQREAQQLGAKAYRVKGVASLDQVSAAVEKHMSGATAHGN